MMDFDDFYTDCMQAIPPAPSAISYPDMPALPANTVVAMAYVPFQQFKSVYCAEEGLKSGTMFPELNKPFAGRKCQ